MRILEAATSGYRLAAALCAGTLLALSSLSSAQEINLPDFDLPSFDISVEIPDGLAEGAARQAADALAVEAGPLASGISEALIATATEIAEEVAEELAIIPEEAKNNDEELAQVLE